MIRRLVAASALLLLAACGPGAPKTDPNDPYAGLEPEILKWRADIEASHPNCKAKVEGKGCERFEVTCKGARDIAAAERASGVTAKVVAAMEFSAKTADGSTGKGGSAFAEFTKASGAWTRSETAPINPATCAAL